MKYCSECAAPVTTRIPAGDHRPRYVCPACGTIHYQNPKVVAGCIPEWGDEILLCKRAIEPRIGFWTLPAGFMENEETADEAASRETLEETGAQTADLELFSLYSIPHISQVYLIYRARLVERNFGPTPESEQVRLFAQQDIPWDRIAFPVVRLTLEKYFEHRAAGRFQLTVGTIDRRS